MSTSLDVYFTLFINFFSRTDVVISVFVSLGVAFLTLKYLSSNEGVEVKEVAYETTLGEQVLLTILKRPKVVFI